ncbi:MAG: O-acetyl-ADP-ribose deacetylase [Syntrophales bacterium]|nr:O-acetyl-ADP-ribose deacetylase [Syntrophales bacterium]
MEVKIKNARLVLVKGDITEEETDAIVNAANSRLAGGGGVDGAIHRAGGPSIMEECRKIGGCPTGQAVITSAGNLKARYVIHAVGPIYQGGTKGEEKLLRSAYEESLKLASKKGLKSISFPALSAGAYGYPLDEAARVALQAVIDYLKTTEGIELVRFVLFDDRTFEAFKRQLTFLKPTIG